MYLSVDCLLDNGLLCIKYNFSYSMFLFKHITPRVIIIGLFLLFAAFSRVFIARFAPDLANFSPVGALALFAGAQLGLRWKSFIMPFSFLILSDILINVWVFEGQYGIMYDSFYWTYLVVAAIIVLGHFFASSQKVGGILLSSGLATLTHWGILDFIYWVAGGTSISSGLVLSKDMAGLLEAYAQGAPFAKNFAMGTVAYSLILFGVYALVPSKWKQSESVPLVA